MAIFTKLWAIYSALKTKPIDWALVWKLCTELYDIINKASAAEHAEADAAYQQFTVAYQAQCAQKP